MLTSEPTRGARIFVLVCLAAAVTACTSDDPAPGARIVPERAPGCVQLDKLVRRVARGHVPGRGPDLVPIPLQPTFIGGPNVPVHTGPWDHLAYVPLVVYGPGVVPRVGHVQRPATMADVAPTIGGLIGYDFETRDGRVLDEVVGGSTTPPRLVVVVVWDGGGNNVLDIHDNAPFLNKMIRRGVGYDNFEIGSTPSNTPPIHTTLGTGAFPARHGIPGVRLRTAAGASINPFLGGHGDRIRVPTLADVYDRDRGNRPLIGLVGTKSWHLGMIGHGSRFPGGDQDLTVLINPGGTLFGNRVVFERGPLPDTSVLDEETNVLDLADGTADGRWKDEDLGDIGTRRASPAWVRFQEHVLEDTIVEQGFGRDEVPDLLFTNFKQIDQNGHRWGLASDQVGESVAASDAALRRLAGFLDRNVGRGRWTMMVTADHGIEPFPKDSGHWPIAPGQLAADINEALDDNDNDANLVKRPSASGLFLDMAELDRLGSSLQEIADWVIDYRAEHNVRDGEELPAPWAADPRQKLFAGVVAGKRLLADSCGA